MKIKEKLSSFMKRMKEDNQNASWFNLLTGIIILVIIAVFSIQYFNGKGNNALNGSQNGNGGNSVLNSVDQTKGNSTTTGLGKEVVVQEEEGLWQIAERICGDGEKYVYVAQENNLPVNSALYTGQVLKVSCNY